MTRVSQRLRGSGRYGRRASVLPRPRRAADDDGAGHGPGEDLRRGLPLLEDRFGREALERADSKVSTTLEPALTAAHPGMATDCG